MKQQQNQQQQQQQQQRRHGGSGERGSSGVRSVPNNDAYNDDHSDDESYREDIETMAMTDQDQDEGSSSSAAASALAQSRTTLGPVRKKKKKKRPGKASVTRRQQRPRFASFDNNLNNDHSSIRSFVLPTIDESDETIFSNGSSHHSTKKTRITGGNSVSSQLSGSTKSSAAGGSAIIIVGGGGRTTTTTTTDRSHHRHQNREGGRTDRTEVDVDDLESGRPDASDTSNSTSSNDGDPEKETLSWSSSFMTRTTAKTMTMTNKNENHLVKSRQCQVAMGVFVLVSILFAAIVGGIVGFRKVDARPADQVPPSPQDPVAMAPTPAESTKPMPPRTTESSCNITASSSIYINAGGYSDYVDAACRVWKPDNNTEGTTVYQNCSAPQIFPNTLDRYLYCEERYATNWTDLRYNFSLPRGQYQVVLHFAEIYHQGPGKRIMNISIQDPALQNEIVVTNYDIFERAGGWFRATQKFIEIEVLSVLELRLSPLSGSDNAKINAIEVHNISDARSPEEYFVVNDGTISNTTTPRTPPQPAAAMEQSAVFINAGSNAASLDIDGRTWTSDVQLPAGWVGFGTPQDECGPDERSVFCSYRRFLKDGRYDIPLLNGRYNVSLYFAERLYDEVGERVFHIYVQNQKLPFRRNYDILGQTSTRETTTIETDTFDVVDGFLRIYLERVTGVPIICAIQIVPV